MCLGDAPQTPQGSFAGSHGVRDGPHRRYRSAGPARAAEAPRELPPEAVIPTWSPLHGAASATSEGPLTVLRATKWAVPRNFEGPA
mmetsp:Transcript_30897/g.91827  ORF Transcript_30897/g.91827 Transcript_30897/m.91827 type:complete len:86 (-) Transcript_30897:84-341(-)